MSSAPLPDNERERQLALYECDILDTPRDPLFDSITTLAAQVCEAPIALFSLIDQQRQWFKSNHGLPDVRQTSRDSAFCAHTILSGEMLEIPDVLEDARFLDNPLVVSDPKIRFYAGIPRATPVGSGWAHFVSKTIGPGASRLPNDSRSRASRGWPSRSSSNVAASAGSVFRNSRRWNASIGKS